MSDKKTITILFSKYTDNMSKLIGFFCGNKYTHVSIALDNDYNYFYSFNRKGFRREYPRKHIYRVDSIAYEIEVTLEEFEKIQMKIEELNSLGSSAQYSTLGLLFCFLRISKKFKNKYFCSQFVAETLEENIEWFNLDKKASLYFPCKLNSFIEKNKFFTKVNFNPL